MNSPASWFDEELKGTMAVGQLSDDLLKFRPEKIAHDSYGFREVEYREVETACGYKETRAFLIDPVVAGLSAVLRQHATGAKKGPLS